MLVTCFTIPLFRNVMQSFSKRVHVGSMFYNPVISTERYVGYKAITQYRAGY